MTIFTLLGVRFIDKAGTHPHPILQKESRINTNIPSGRRKMLIGSSTICSFCVLMIIICSALQTQHPNLGLVGISFVYTFLTASAAVWTPCQAFYPAEVLSYNPRAKGLAMPSL
jgi:MFS family permease